MKWAIIVFTVILGALGVVAAHAETSPAAGARLSRASDDGAYQLELTLKTAELQQGVNAAELSVRDSAGKPVEGAEITVTPWMPTMGHGVWEKPVVTERGGGNYRVDNVVIIMSGLWALKVEVRKGKLRDGAGFTYQVAEAAGSKEKAEKAREGLQRQSANYNVPNVTLLNQDGKKVNLRSLVDGGKPVIVNFIFTTCTTICPVMTATFSNLRSELGPAAGERVQLISISIDPENDRPERMKKYLSRFNSGPGWEFLTGTREEIGRVLKAFDAFVVDKMSHEPLFVARAPETEEWVRIKGLVRKSDLMKELERMEKK